jgi:hypothetical protein
MSLVQILKHSCKPSQKGRESKVKHNSILKKISYLSIVFKRCHKSNNVRAGKTIASELHPTPPFSEDQRGDITFPKSHS